MANPRSVAIVIGSLRKASLSRKVANALITQAPASLACRIVEIGDLPQVRSFDVFMLRREANALAAIVTHRDPATFFSPGGDHQAGADAIAKRYAKDAKVFGKLGKSRLEVLQSGASGGLAFWTGLQHAEVRMACKEDPVAMTLRITEVFRLENGDWALVHRHVDMAKAGD